MRLAAALPNAPVAAECVAAGLELLSPPPAPPAALVKLAKALGVTCEGFADCEDIRDGEDKPSKPTGRGAKGKAKGKTKGK